MLTASVTIHRMIRHVEANNYGNSLRPTSLVIPTCLCQRSIQGLHLAKPVMKHLLLMGYIYERCIYT